MRDEALLAMRHGDYTIASVCTAVEMFDEVVLEYRANVRAGHFCDAGDDPDGHPTRRPWQAAQGGRNA